jgi:hypothetical protein
MSDWQFDLGNPKSSGKPAGIFATIFLILFATPFAGFGLLAVVQGIKKLIAGETKDGLMLCLFGLIFCSVGFGLMLGTVWSRKKSRRWEEQKSRHPDQPWVWRADWAAGRIKSSVSTQAVLFAIMALGFGGLGGLATFFTLPEELRKGNHAALLVLLFPAVGIGFLLAVVRALLSRRRFGDCFFEMAAIPGAVGGTLEGLIQTGARIRLEHGLHLKLTCIRRTVTGYGKGKEISENVLWQDEKVFKSEAGLPEPEPGRSGIPVYFKIPADQPECFSSGNNSVLWRLEAKAKMAGPDFSAMFEVPVFNVAGAAAGGAADDSDPTAPLQMPVEEIRRNEHSKIQVADGPDGREFYFPAARNVGPAIFTTILFLVSAGILYAIILHHLPVMAEAVLGLFAVVLGCFSFALWFKSSRVTIDSTGVRATNRYLFFTRQRRFDAGSVARFVTKPGMTSGTKVFLDIKLVTRDRDDSFEAEKAKYQRTGQMPPLKFRVSDPGGVTIASGIASTAEANWLVQEMTKALSRCP